MTQYTLVEYKKLGLKYEIELKKKPGRFQQLFGVKTKTYQFIGDGDDWFDESSGLPARTTLLTVIQKLVAMHQRKQATNH